ncbi:MAG: Omp28-related outer membrane protein [Candidatus Cryptobacteroides sp.]
MKKILFTLSACGLCLFSCTKPDDGGNNKEPDPDPVVDEFVPELPADNSSDGVRHLVMLTDFTGSSCPGCPALLQALYAVLEDQTIASRVVMTAAHQFKDDDPAYFSDKKLYESFGITQFPSLVINLCDKYDVGVTNQSNLRSWITAAQSETPKAGICASVGVKDGVVYVNTRVKALEDNSFRVGAWLVEDGIYAVQSGTANDKYYTHNACLRVADSKLVNSFQGLRIGNLKKDATADHLFKIKLDPSWKSENCRVVVFVSAKNDSDDYAVTNVAATSSLEDTVAYK